jgi:hypothetical protein
MLCATEECGDCCSSAPGLARIDAAARDYAQLNATLLRLVR